LVNIFIIAHLKYFLKFENDIDINEVMPSFALDAS
jgi:RNA recognition motif-containing protein